ncbi:MAG TPA: hypothetical protein VNR64_00020, partial [Vicinamibacterales bacterium]|nr:hypothetical protein [Vicinamibacterales bacterium]
MARRVRARVLVPCLAQFALLLLFSLVAQPAHAASIGVGCTTATYIDADCDGYGVGAPNGPDADDHDPSVNTPSSVIAKYGTIRTFLATVKGYSPANIWYLNPASGNDSTCRANDAANPCKTWAAMRGKAAGGDAILVRAGTVSENANYDFPAGGSAGSQTIVMAYPGEAAVFTHAAGTGFYGFVAQNSWVTFDGLKLTTADLGKGMGFSMSGTRQLSHVTIRNMEVSNYYTDVWAISGMDNVVIEGSVIHDGRAEHNVYVGQNTADSGPIVGLVVQDNILYNAQRDNFHNNGLCGGCTLARNIMYSANQSPGGGAANISLQQGWHNSTIADNVILFGSAYGLLFNNY